MIISKKHSHVSCLLTCQLYRSQLQQAIVITLLSVALSGCDNFTDSSPQQTRAKPTTHRVEVVTAENKAVSLTQTVSGTLQANTKIRLYNEESGRITQLPYYEGDAVKKGTLLIQLDNELIKIDLSKAKASREQAKVDLSRLKKLLPKKIATEEEVARAQTILNLAIAEEKQQATRLQRTSIKAPIDGLITKRLYEPSDMLAPQSHIHTLIDPTELRLKISLAERWVPFVKKDQTVVLRIDALGDRAINAKIIRVHPTINTDTHKGVIEILLSPVPEGATAGQFARAEIKLTATNRLVIPVHTIHFEPEGAYVYRIIANDGASDGDNDNYMIAEKVYFKQGQQFDSLTEIYSGLAAGDKIVSRGYLGLRDGKKVTIAEREPNIK